MTHLVPFHVAHFDTIEWQDAQAAGRAYYQREWAEEIADHSDAWSLVADDGYVVACAGVFPTRLLRVVGGADQPLEAIAWAIFSPRLGAHARSVIKAIRAFLDERPEYRIEAYVDASHEKAAPFLERLGFVLERAVEGEHPDGRPLQLYARVRH